MLGSIDRSRIRNSEFGIIANPIFLKHSTAIVLLARIVNRLVDS